MPCMPLLDASWQSRVILFSNLSYILQYGTLAPVLPDHTGNDPMVLMLFQPTDNHNSDHALYTLHADGYGAVMDRKLASLVLTQGELCLERGLIPGIFAVHEPSAAPPPQHCVPLALDPTLVIWHNTRSGGTLEDDLAVVGERDRYHRGRREGKKPGPKKIAENPGIIYGERIESERITICLQLL